MGVPQGLMRDAFRIHNLSEASPGPRPTAVRAGAVRPLVQRRPESGWPAYHDMTARIAVLERAPVFFAFAEGTLRALARRLRRGTVAAGELSLHQGEHGDSNSFIEQERSPPVVEKPPSAETGAVPTTADHFGHTASLLERRH